MRTIAALCCLSSILCLLNSCGQDTKATEKRLDSLALIAWEAEAELTGIETGTWKELCAEARKNVEFINFNFKDTMDRETALSIDQYAGAAKTLESFIGDFEAIGGQVSKATEQVNLLKQDFTKRARPLDSINAYIALETKNLEVLNQAVDAKTDFARQQAGIIQQHAAEINALMEELKKNEQNTY